MKLCIQCKHLMPREGDEEYALARCGAFFTIHPVSGVKRALAEFRGGLVKPAPRVTLRVGWLPYHLGGSFVQNNRQQNEQLTGCFIYDLVMSLVNLIYR